MRTTNREGKDSMYCTKCGIELAERDNFCSQCAAPTGQAPPSFQRMDPLRRTTNNAKIAGVCGGFARYFDVDVTLIRVLWVVVSVWPVPFFGVIAYLVAWAVMPKDPLALPAPTPGNYTAHTTS